MIIKSIYPYIPEYPEWRKIQREDYFTYLTKMDGELYEIFYYPRASLVLKKWAKTKDGKELNIESESLMQNGKWHQELFAINGVENSRLSPIRDRILKNLPETLMEHML